jgi:2-polyprenyl-6-methoxyphenol hydroxylase-like FAD-dependent oxidoreductase
MKTTIQGDERFLSSDIFDVEREKQSPRKAGDEWNEPARSIPIFHRCDVLVVGGGPAGTAAAAAAARAGADVTLLERYNHLGGLSTGGLVIWIDRMTDWEGHLTIRGFAQELVDRLPPDAIAGPASADWGSRDPTRAEYWGPRTAAFHGIVTWSPTIDPERLKLISQEMLLERGVRVVFHTWAAMPIVEENTVKGVVFESKEGRQAILAKVVVDCTGDGDMFSRAGARSARSERNGLSAVSKSP